jgi:hypothetical protein
MHDWWGSFLSTHPTGTFWAGIMGSRDEGYRIGESSLMRGPGALPILAAILGLSATGCDSPELGRARGGGPGGDGGNYVRGRIEPPSKIDSTKDLRRIDHYGPGPSDWR